MRLRLLRNRGARKIRAADHRLPADRPGNAPAADPGIIPTRGETGLSSAKTPSLLKTLAPETFPGNLCRMIRWLITLILFRCAKITEVGGWRVHGWVGAVRESSVNNLKRYQ